MKQEIKTEFIIKSSSEKVYKILTNLSDYENWNPFIIKSEGTVKVGNRIKNTMKNGDKQIVFKPKILEANYGESFAWLGSLGMKGVFDGYHYFHIQQVDEGRIRLIQGEKFSGLLANLILKKIGKQTEQNFLMMNQAIKNLAEKEK